MAGSGSRYQVTFANPNGENIADIVATGDTLKINEVQTLTVSASSGQFKLRFEGSVTATQFLNWDISAADLETRIQTDLGVADVSVVREIADIPNTAVYTITFLNPADTDKAQLEVVENVGGQPADFTLARTVKERIETQLNLPDPLTSPVQLKDFTIEIVRNSAKNKVRLITGGTIDSAHYEPLHPGSRPPVGGRPDPLDPGCRQPVHHP